MKLPKKKRKREEEKKEKQKKGKEAKYSLLYCVFHLQNKKNISLLCPFCVKRKRKEEQKRQSKAKKREKVAHLLLLLLAALCSFCFPLVSFDGVSLPLGNFLKKKKLKG